MATLAADVGRRAPSDHESQGLVLTYQRLMLVMLLFAGVTALVVLRLGYLQVFTDRSGASGLNNPLIPPRADITDRNGIALARTIDAWSIGLQPRNVIGDRGALAVRLNQLIPQRSVADYQRMLASDVPFLYLARRALPEMVQAINAIGEPGIIFNREPERLYPQTQLAGHVLGGTSRSGHGMAGMERVLEERLTAPGMRNRPVALSIDSRVQATMEAELVSAVTAMNAEGGAGIVLDVATGEVVAMASAPTVNPNVSGDPNDVARRNNATMAVYELGSVFKPITVAAAMEARVVTSLSQRWDASSPVPIGRFRISDDHPLGRAITVPELLVHSSNIATARIADQMGMERMQAAFRAVGFDEPAHIELRERARPLWPAEWSRATVLTSGFGHGVAITPLHLASAYAALVNGGIWRPATLLRVDPSQVPEGRRVYSEETSLRMRQMLRMIVTNGTGRRAEAPGFRVGGKTGTAERAGVGGYSRSVNVSTFAAAFPMDAPRYVVVVMVDAARPTEANSFVTTAAYTAAPIVSRVISRVGPLLGIIPDAGRDIDTSAVRPLVAGAGD